MVCDGLNPARESSGYHAVRKRDFDATKTGEDLVPRRVRVRLGVTTNAIIDRCARRENLCYRCPSAGFLNLENTAGR